jgi:hypothetical protein
MAVNKNWLLTRSNIRRLRQAADAAADDAGISRTLKNYFIDLQNILGDIENELRRSNA